MEDPRLHPVVGIVLDVLQIYADDVLGACQRLFVFCECSYKVDARERMH